MTTSAKKLHGQLYRPSNHKPVLQGIAWASGGSFNVAQAIDLSLPIRALFLEFTGRLVIGTAAFTSVTPEGFLNLISNIVIQGTNARQKGNVTMVNGDLATLWVTTYLFGPKGMAGMTISITGAGGDAFVPDPGTPFPAAGTAVPNRSAGYINGATGTYDFAITLCLPFHPYEANSLGKQPESVAGFLVRNEEWKDSFQISLTYGAQAGANGIGALGLAAGTTTVVFSSYGSGSGSPTINIYSLPVLMGMDHKDLVLPGVLSRVVQPINTALLTAAGNPATLMNLQKQPTPRIILKTGTVVAASSVFPAFTALSDVIVAQVGVTLGGNRTIRNLVNGRTYKHEQLEHYDTLPIQGYYLIDFMQSGNPDSSFEGQSIGDGSTLQVTANVPGTANAQGLILQEQILHQPTGALYS